MKSRSSTGLLTCVRVFSCVMTATLMAGFVSAAEIATSSSSSTATSEPESHLNSPTHRQVRLIEPTMDGKPVSRLYTIATTPTGEIVAGVSGQANAVLLMNSEGKTLQQWSLELTPTGIAVAPDGTIYAGGSGRIAQLGANGTIVKVIDSPHVGSVEELKKKAAESIRASRAQMSASYDRQIEILNDRVAKIEDKDEDDRSKLEEAQLKAFKTQLQMLEKLAKPEESAGGVPDSHLSAAVMRTMNITSMAASDTDLFVCATDPGRGGYSIWRMSRDLDSSESKVIMDGLRGCCGQMDIQCCEAGLVISENTKFKVGIYDRDGRAQENFGKRDRTSRAGFGGCCNPMNSLPMSDGTVLIAESSIGHIKRFDTDGNLVAYIGKAGIGGGCKHCALGFDEKNDLYYMMYQDKNAICVLANNANTPMTLAEKELQQRQTDFLARATGLWKMDSDKPSNKRTGGLISLFGGGRGGSTQHPVTSLKLESSGKAKIIEGMYKAYGDQAQLALLPESEGSNSIPFALEIDQVRFLEGTWKFDSEDVATVSFQGMASVVLKRDASADSCGGADCKNEGCSDPNCPQHQQAGGQTVAVSVESAIDGLFADDATAEQSAVASPLMEVPYQSTPLQANDEANAVKAYELAMEKEAANEPSTPPQPYIQVQSTFQYKLISKKDLGENAEVTLNRLGAEGWECCGRIGKQLMFKRRAAATLSTGSVSR